MTTDISLWPVCILGMMAVEALCGPIKKIVLAWRWNPSGKDGEK